MFRLALLSWWFFASSTAFSNGNSPTQYEIAVSETYNVEKSSLSQGDVMLTATSLCQTQGKETQVMRISNRIEEQMQTTTVNFSCIDVP
ncbi:hypothetical protein VFDL14_10005 [Vibrio fortis]|uniref:Uncharacterized protein n=1 Tax=Vibrio fortis TaxID=212667 RepID=A0A066UHI7_9VIBR|nr:hypothetical protein [Vibrio fortis]KDN26540.1 hypothetical protein VFDL14_10005 [Vibrio fortis]